MWPPESASHPTLFIATSRLDLKYDGLELGSADNPLPKRENPHTQSMQQLCKFTY